MQRVSGAFTRRTGPVYPCRRETPASEPKEVSMAALVIFMLLVTLVIFGMIVVVSVGR